MTSIPAILIFMFFWYSDRLYVKAYVALAAMSIFFIVTTLIIINLKLTLWTVFKTLIILDTFTIRVIISSLALFGFMQFLDQDQWEIKILQTTFIVGGLTKMLNIRILILYMKWKRIHVISYKIMLNLMALMYFSAGVYCSYQNYNFAFKSLKIFNQQCRYFVLLTTFAAFDSCYQLVTMMGTFDYTDTLKYDYVIKNSNINYCKKGLKSLRKLGLVQENK